MVGEHPSPFDMSLAPLYSDLTPGTEWSQSFARLNGEGVYETWEDWTFGAGARPRNGGVRHFPVTVTVSPATTDVDGNSVPPQLTLSLSPATQEGAVMYPGEWWDGDLIGTPPGGAPRRVACFSFRVQANNAVAPEA